MKLLFQLREKILINETVNISNKEVSDYTQKGSIKANWKVVTLYMKNEI